MSLSLYKNPKPLFLQIFMNLGVGWVEEVKPNNQKPRYCWVTLRSNATRFMPGNPSGLRQLTAVALCRGTLSAVAPGGNPHDRAASPPHCLLYAGKPVHRNGLPSTAMAYRPPQWLPNLHLFLYFQSDKKGLNLITI